MKRLWHKGRSVRHNVGKAQGGVEEMTARDTECMTLIPVGRC